MTESEVVQIMRRHFESLFPRACPNCQLQYPTLRDYILKTQRVGPTVSYDVELQAWKPENPLGAFAAVNCVCKTTMVLSTQGVPLEAIHAVLAFVKDESVRRGEPPMQTVSRIRDQVREQALASAGLRHGPAQQRARPPNRGGIGGASRHSFTPRPIQC